MRISRRAVVSAAALVAPGVARADDGIVFPFALTRNRPWAAVQVDGRDPAMPFLIDTGASGFCILQAKAQEMKLAKMGTALAQGSIGRGNIAVYEASLLLGGHVKQDRTPLFGLPHLTPPMLGLIPLPRLQAMGLDYDKREVLLINRPPKDMEGYLALDLDVGRGEMGSANIMGAHATEYDARMARDHRPVVPAEFNGEPVKLLVDTGFVGGLYLFPDYVKKKGLWDDTRVFSPMHTVGIFGASRARLIRGERLKIGRIVFAKPLVILGDPADSDLDGGKDAVGVVGMEFLRRLNMLVQPAQRRLWIKPSAAITDGYRYDRAGAEIDVVGDAARVVRLDPGSPADRAGLRDGDKVTGWRGRDGIDGLSWALKGAPGSKVDIQVERDGKSELISVVLEERI